MWQQDKLVAGFLPKLKDFTWDEFERLMNSRDTKRPKRARPAPRGDVSAAKFITTTRTGYFTARSRFIPAVVSHQDTDVDSLNESFRAAVHDYLE
jgi:hypothetical protein